MDKNLKNALKEQEKNAFKCKFQDLLKNRKGFLLLTLAAL